MNIKLLSPLDFHKCEIINRNLMTDEYVLEGKINHHDYFLHEIRLDEDDFEEDCMAFGDLITKTVFLNAKHEDHIAESINHEFLHLLLQSAPEWIIEFFN